MRLPVALALALLVTAFGHFEAHAQARSPLASQPQRDGTARLIDQARGSLQSGRLTGRLELLDCERVGWLADQGVQRKDLKAMLSKARMHERGECVPEDIDKAIDLYTASYNAGARWAADRLAGLAPTREGGFDVVATLWWARRSERARAVFDRQADCDPAPGQPAPNVDRFVDAIKQWSDEQVHRCLASVGFRSLVMAEMYYPREALRQEFEGIVDVTYDLQQGSFRVTPDAQAKSELTQFVEQVLAETMARTSRSQQALAGRFSFAFRIDR